MVNEGILTRDFASRLNLLREAEAASVPSASFDPTFSDFPMAPQIDRRITHYVLTCANMLLG